MSERDTKLSVMVAIPVKDGSSYLRELLDAVAAQQIDADVSTLVVDSGSQDDSLRIARERGAEVIEIPAAEFGHGRTRNLAAEHSNADVIVFLTQDATPAHDRWLASLIKPLNMQRRVGLSFGPHLARPDTSPMIARELTEFFGSFSSSGETRIDNALRDGDPASGFFSNVNSAILRECWSEQRFRDLPYAEDQAFARDAYASGWSKAYVPTAAVLHAHDYPFSQFMRRYFDEYRGLQATTGHVEPLRGRTLPGTIGREVRADSAFMRGAGWSTRKRAAGTLRSLRHHSGRYLFAVLGSRAQHMRPSLRARLSLEGRDDATAGKATGRTISADRDWPLREIADYHRLGMEPLVADTSDGPGLDIAWIIPPFAIGSGGHSSIFRIVGELERKGHRCSIWVHDPEAKMPSAKRVRESIRESFTAIEAEVHVGLEGWRGAQLALATGWQTAYVLARLPRCAHRAYLVQDYEPDFYPTSAERIWAEQTYSMGHDCITASPWLASVLERQHGARCASFELGVDFGTYRARAAADAATAADTVVFYARSTTPRRGTQLGLMALAEVVRRRPQTRVVVYGDARPPSAPFDYEFRGILPGPRLADLYNEATVGVVLSLTNYSLIPKEMMACGLPVVDVKHPSAQSVFGDDPDTVTLTDADPAALAGAIAELLDDAGLRERRSARSLAFVSSMTWAAATDQIEAALIEWTGAGSGDAAIRKSS